MTSRFLTTSAAALILFGAAATQAQAAEPQWGGRSPYGYGYEQRRDGGRDRRAFDNGARDGYGKGFDDLRRRRSPDVRRQRWFRNGDRDYQRWYGPRDEYRMEYRRGFEEGYQRAYREGWRGEGWRGDGWRRY